MAVAVLSGQATYLYLKWQQRSETLSPRTSDAPSTYAETNRAAAFITDDATDRPPAMRYRLRAEALLAAAVAEEGIAYRDVIDVAYGAGTIDAALLARKATWRRRLSEEFTFFADYSLIRMVTPVRKVDAVRDTATGETIAGIFAQPENVILISGRSPTILLHEAGHVLQRNAQPDIPGFKIPNSPNALEPLALDGITEIFAAYREGRLSSREERRLTYLVTQKEFEMLLQDLNRMHAVFLGGEPIMTPKDAVRALHLIGLTQYREQVAAAVADTEWSRVSDEVDQLQYLALAPDAPRIFPDAARVVELHTLAQQANPALWQRIYRKILFEAPGHL